LKDATANISNPERILLVDDEGDVISPFKTVLEMNGFQVDAYTDPSAALSSFKPNSYGFHQFQIISQFGASD
jgi:DNA-binding response OmpR family regulator